jgi:hypothetical protein
VEVIGVREVNGSKAEAEVRFRPEPTQVSRIVFDALARVTEENPELVRGWQAAGAASSFSAHAAIKEARKELEAVAEGAALKLSYSRWDDGWRLDL